MHKSNKFALVNLWQLYADIISILLSYIFSYMISSKFTALFPMDKYTWILIIFIPLWTLTMTVLNMYNSTTFNYNDRILRNISFSSIVSCIFLAATMFFIKEVLFSRILYFAFSISSTIILILERFLFLYISNKFNSKSTRNALIVGTTEVLEKFEYYIKKTNFQMNVLGHVLMGDNSRSNTDNTLGYLENLEEILKKNAVDEVIFTLPGHCIGEVEKYLLLCEEMGITVRLVLQLYDLKLYRTHFGSIGTLPMLTYHSVPLNRFQLSIKRLFDILGAFTGLILISIPTFIIAVAIKLDSKGPVIFKQERVGRNGRLFKLYKFRSMHTNAEERKKELMKQNQVSGGLMFKIKNDPRITKIGSILRKTSLDELPQFYNVLRGDMSLVGTRPPTPDEVQHYKASHYRRISMKPGITGLWQVSGRSEITNFDDVVMLDTEYIDKWSIWLDIKILLKTFVAVFKHKGAM